MALLVQSGIFPKIKVIAIFVYYHLIDQELGNLI